MLEERQNLPSTTSVIVPTDSGYSHHRQPIGAALLRIEPRQIQGVVGVAKDVGAQLRSGLRRRVSGFDRKEKRKRFTRCRTEMHLNSRNPAGVKHYEARASSEALAFLSRW